MDRNSQPPHRIRFWVEKAIVKDRPDRQQGDHALGRALWSLQEAEAAKRIYDKMLEVREGDVVFHFTNSEKLEGYSIAAESVDRSFIGIEGTAWGGRPALRIRLRAHRKLEPAIDRSEFLQSPTYKSAVDRLLETAEGLFFNRKFNLNPGCDLTEAPVKLVQIWNDIYLRKTGRPINSDWNLGPFDLVSTAPPILQQIHRNAPKVVFPSSCDATTTNQSFSAVLFIMFGTPLRLGTKAVLESTVSMQMNLTGNGEPTPINRSFLRKVETLVKHKGYPLTKRWTELYTTP